MARLIHHVGMWVVMIFAVMHIYFVILASIVERIGTFDSIVSGYKFVSQAKSRHLVSGELAPQSRQRRRSASSSSDWAMSCSATTGLAPLRSRASSATIASRRACAWKTAARLVCRFWGCSRNSERVILVDAVRTDSPPGTLVRIDGEDVMDAVRDRLSPHQVGVADLLDAARLIDCYPSAVTLLGLVPEAIDLSVVRSSAVDSGARRACRGDCRARCKALATRWFREPEAEGRHCPIRDLTHHFGM